MTRINFGEQKENRENTHEKIKRFDDIFRILLLIISIIISFRIGNLSLSNIVVFIFLPLGFWIFGHAHVGCNDSIANEVCFKLCAWAVVSVAIPVVFLKSALGFPSLDHIMFFACIIFSILLTIWAREWLKEAFSKQPYLKRQLYFFMFSLVGLVYFVAMGYLTI